MVTIIPAIDAATKEQFQKDLDKIEGAESLTGGWLHLDFADGQFVKNTTVDPESLGKLYIDLNLEAHLMVSSPEKWVAKLKELGVKRLIAHVEVDEICLDSFITGCREAGIEAGLAIKIDTPLVKLDPYWDIIDLVLVMSVEPGLQGRPFIPAALSRVEQLKSLCRDKGYQVIIGIDGHVNDGNIKEIIHSGVDNLVIGSYFLEGDIEENVEKIWEKVNS